MHNLLSYSQPRERGECAKHLTTSKENSYLREKTGALSEVGQNNPEQQTPAGFQLPAN